MPDIQLTNGNDKYEHIQGQNWANIYGLDGDDDLKVNRNGALVGGKGNDKLTSTVTDDGRWGGQVGYWDSPGAVYVDLELGFALDGWGSRDTLIGIREINFGGSNRHGDIGLGDKFDNRFYLNDFSQPGSIYIDGRLGNDTVGFWRQSISDYNITVSADGTSVVFERNGYKATFVSIETYEFNRPDMPSQRYSPQDLIDFKLVGEQTLIETLAHGWKANSLGSNQTLTYSFMTAMPAYAASQGITSFTASSISYQSAVRSILSRLGDQIGIKFLEVSELGSSNGQIRFGTSQQAFTRGLSFIPGAITDEKAGDVILDLETTYKLAPGQEGYQVLLHEIGHALGLSHPLLADDSSVRPLLLPKWQDPAYTVMSDKASTSGLWQTWFGLLDIQALKKLYLAESVNAAASVYKLQDTIGLSITTIDDLKGFDTIDLSSLSFGARLDLMPSGISSVGLTFEGVPAQNNLIISSDTYIEKVIGTNSDDVLKGNFQNNQFTPRAGNDLVDGLSGFDEVNYVEKKSTYSLYKSEWSGDWICEDKSFTLGSDTLKNIERIHFNDTSVALDMDGNAGTVAKTLALTFGAGMLKDKVIAGIALYYMDDLDYDPARLMELGLAIRLGPTPAESVFIDLLFTGLYGITPTISQAQVLSNLLKGMSQTQLAVMSVQYEKPYLLNAALNVEWDSQINLKLIGLANTGFDYVVFGS
jgi:serralysin